jgi:hypothetical protein
MMKLLYVSVVLLALTTACSSSNDDLSSFENVNPGPYNQELKQAYEQRQGWANDPAEATRQFFKLAEGEGNHSTSLTVKTVDQESVVTFTQEGIGDDSVLGEKRVITFKREGDGWNIVSIKVGYKCIDGRGHTHYSGAPCS